MTRMTQATQICAIESSFRGDTDRSDVVDLGSLCSTHTGRVCLKKGPTECSPLGGIDGRILPEFGGRVGSEMHRTQRAHSEGSIGTGRNPTRRTNGTRHEQQEFLQAIVSRGPEITRDYFDKWQLFGLWSVGSVELSQSSQHNER